jgi:hopene-associated glycosyltransferase HpnB
VPILLAVTGLALLAWLYLLAGHGRFWLPGPGLPPVPRGAAAPPPWPSVTAVIPARDEAAILPRTLPSLAGQRYPGELAVVVVDDNSADGTGEVAAAVGEASAAGVVRVVSGAPLPAGWAGKVWAMAQGAQAAGPCDYLLFTDADIWFAPEVAAGLVRAAMAGDRALVSQMALLRAESGWERWIVPAFVYFFAQLYPFRWVARRSSRTAAAAGGCMLVRRDTLVKAGGLEQIAGARIDDVALARLLKQPPVQADCWLGFARDVRSLRPYPGLASLWHMVARSAYTQLRYSPALLAGTIAGLLWLYLLPPAVGIAGLAGLAAGAGQAAGWCAGLGLAAWAVMSVTAVPVLRLYRLSPWRAPGLPLVAVLYAGMTGDSALRHYTGRGGEWKGRSIPVR